MTWDVEYTDEFGRWWESLSEAEQDSVAVAVELLEELGPQLRHLTARECRARVTGGCESCEFNTLDGRSASCMHSTPDGSRSCSLGATRRAMIGGTRRLSQWLTGYTTSI